MSQGRSSLLSGTGLEESASSKGGKAPKGSGGGLDGAGMVKLAIGGVALVAGVFLILRSLGVFEPNQYGPAIPEAQAQQIEEERKAEEKKFLELNKNVQIGGA
ncbi:MAG: hypothetical protein KF912_09070 [Phycisphaeraceae bacterium]|nr:hypothetical protein [Phycisphaeraceae bacterium]MBX3367447.1 hypothetical protein [Phycisphaeraceae bacterium]QYK47076.1 MAG: hypothetical protein KF838_09805 [Phycisphaeraceae bacterium]